MQWSGKLVGGAVGMLVGGPVGAALGVLAGHLVDDKVASNQGEGSAGGKVPPAQPTPTPAPKPRAKAFHHVEDGDPFAEELNTAEPPDVDEVFAKACHAIVQPTSQGVAA